MSVKFHRQNPVRLAVIHCISLSLIVPALAIAADLPSVPTPRHTATNSYSGTVVLDDYQWLENPAATEVKDWTREQNERTRAYFSRLSYRDGIAQQLLQLRSEESARYSS